MRTRYRWDKDLEMLVEIGGNSNYFEERDHAPAVISDDVGAGVNGLRHMPSGKHLDSKSAHRRENRARGLEEVGNERDFANKRHVPSADTYMREVIDARDQIRSNYNGTADRLTRDRERSNG